MRHKFTWDDFMQMEVRRNQDQRTAEIIVDYYQGDPVKPVRLIGFLASIELTDYEVLELGFRYYQCLLRETRRA